MKTRAARAALAAMAATLGLATAGAVRAVEINDIFLFGDSYTDTGAFFPLTNGSTAGAYLASHFGIPLVTSKEPTPGTRGVNFARAARASRRGRTPQRRSRAA